MLNTIAFFLLTASTCALSWIALKNWKGAEYLCDDCAFNEPELCLKPERPNAISCTAYRSNSGAKDC